MPAQRQPVGRLSLRGASDKDRGLGRRKTQLHSTSELTIIVNRPFSKYQIFSMIVRTKTIGTRGNECEKYLHIIHFPLSLSSKPLFQAES